MAVPKKNDRLVKQLMVGLFSYLYPLKLFIEKEFPSLERDINIFYHCQAN